MKDKYVPITALVFKDEELRLDLKLGVTHF